MIHPPNNHTLVWSLPTVNLGCPWGTNRMLQRWHCITSEGQVRKGLATFTLDYCKVSSEGSQTLCSKSTLVMWGGCVTSPSCLSHLCWGIIHVNEEPILDIQASADANWRAEESSWKPESRLQAYGPILAPPVLWAIPAEAPVMSEKRQAILIVPTPIPDLYNCEHNKMVKSVGFGVVCNVAINKWNGSERQQRVYKLSQRDPEIKKCLGAGTIRKISFLIRKSGVWAKAPGKSADTWGETRSPYLMWRTQELKQQAARLEKSIGQIGEGDEYQGK